MNTGKYNKLCKAQSTQVTGIKSDSEDPVFESEEDEREPAILSLFCYERAVTPHEEKTNNKQNFISV